MHPGLRETCFWNGPSGPRFSDASLRRRGGRGEALRAWPLVRGAGHEFAPLEIGEGNRGKNADLDFRVGVDVQSYNGYS